MNWLTLSKQVIWTILITVPLVGCGTPDNTPTSKPSPEPAVVVGELVFDETQECTVSIPTELPPGRYSIVLRNLTKEDVNIFVSRHVGGKTFQDVLDLQGEPGVSLSEPVYDELFDKLIEPGTAQHTPDGGEVHTYKFISEGEYIVGVWVWETAESDAIYTWFCAPLWVKEAPSE